MSQNYWNGETDTIGVIGIGYVGLRLSLAFAECGFDVVGVDIDAERVHSVRSGNVQGVDSERINQALSDGLRVTIDTAALSQCEAYIFAVPTGLDGDDPDFSSLSAAVDMVVEHCPVGGESLFVLSSTVHPGVVENIVEPRLAELAEPTAGDVHVAVVPERISPGNNHRIGEIPHVVGADTDRSRTLATSLFDYIASETYTVSSVSEAAVSKLIENSYRLVNISMMNELAMLAEHANVDIWESIDAAATKPFGYQPFYPGPGAGGHCVPVDPLFLQRWGQVNGVPLRTIGLAADLNDKMPERVVDRIEESYTAGAIEQADVLAYGISYKPNVADIRNSAAKRVCSLLAGRAADVTVVDPHVASSDLPEDVTRANTVPEERADVVLYLVDHEEFESKEVVAQGEFVYDTTGVLDPNTAENVVSLGRPTTKSSEHRETVSESFGAVQ